MSHTHFQNHKSTLQLQIEAIWELLNNDANARSNPVQASRTCLANQFGLAPQSAYQKSLKIIKLLDEKGKIEICYRRGKGRPIDSVEIKYKGVLNSAELINSVTIPNSKEKRITQAVQDEISEIKRQLSVLTSQTPHNSAPPALPVQEKPTVRNVAVWIDTPNISKTCRSCNIEPPYRKIIDTIRENLGDIVIVGAFCNQNAPEGLLKMFKTFDFVIINCVSPKSEFIQGYDPVDQEMDRVARMLADVASSHVIISGDRDFNPLASFLRTKGKTVGRMYVDQESQVMKLRINGTIITIGCKFKPAPAGHAIAY
ncbi:MAG: hypothetical protein COV29_04295 [Candidatus Yanofskybacteria bacterium CG10_big_fil_rev_8_21_14_0_10_36_16]|uniref:NYN domain-containing protein n=1 Tax=Candidatus Yanofskybacteria bacterium CG10_big_fil_rev_8_21_14_0_10_36_16 TaxID=1975096 RepID=A0A2J0Q6D8_9BACT|nr:MAG: hypothetical protein COV29_04295 [Candidatus Yanofskybacteria bacterium CG10_big_fil_rev_8_21_14_0_10_36_16]